MAKNAREPLLKTDDDQMEELDSNLRPSQIQELQMMRQEQQGQSIVTFKMHVGQAVRIAVVNLLVAVPMLIPGYIADANWAGGFVCMIQYVIFTAYADLGTTVMYAWQGFMGTFIAVLFSHVMHAVMPGGAGGTDYSPLIAHGGNIIFVVLGLTCNFSTNVTMFMLCYHCYFHMDLVNPGATAVYNKSWAIEMEGYPTITMICATAGVWIAVLAMIVPWPYLASRTGHKLALQSVDNLSIIMLDMNHYYNRSSRSVEVYRIKKQIEDLEKTVGSMGGTMDASWWEAMFVDFGKWGAGSRKRQLLQRHMKLMFRMVDNCGAVYQSVEKESFGDVHTRFMDGVKAEVTTLLKATRDLLVRGTAAAEDATISKAEAAELRTLLADVRAAMEALAQKYYQVRQEVSPNEVLCYDMQSETFYLYGLTVYARYAVDYMECLLNHEIKVVPFHNMLIGYIKDSLDISKVIHDEDYRSFVIRNSLAVLICFYLGFFCFSYDGTAAGTVSLLLTNFAGSALLKNMGRLQGVVMGNILPHIFTNALGYSCYEPRIFLQGGVMLAYLTLALFVYYSSPNFGYIALLASAFGGPILAFQCQDETALQLAQSEQTFEHTAYNKIVQTTICVLVLVFVDLILAPERASTKALDQVGRALVRLDGALSAIFLERHPDGTVKGGAVKNRYLGKIKFNDHIAEVAFIDAHERDPATIKGLLDSATTLTLEADKEARAWRSPWPASYFDQVVTFCKRARNDIILMDSTLTGSDDDYDDVFGTVRKLDTFSSLKKDLLQLMIENFDMVNLVLQNETGKDQKAQVREMMDKNIGTLEGMRELFEDVNGRLTYPEDREQCAKTIEDDDIARIQVILMLIDSTAYEAAKLVSYSVEAA